VLLFVIAGEPAGQRLDGVTLRFLAPGVVTLIFVLGIFDRSTLPASSGPGRAR
jgi:hypothetical protein